MGVGEPYTTITEPTFVAQFLLDPDTDTADSVANVDAQFGGSQGGLT